MLLDGSVGSGLAEGNAALLVDRPSVRACVDGQRAVNLRLAEPP
ncbi:hypothetical protein BCAR13_80037 [Paraburkholderia caribensis]|nr:hypothetical protein BCAR13_80037 [Paraburkholderia caribensis]